MFHWSLFLKFLIIIELKETFKLLDKNRDGNITAEELKEGAKYMGHSHTQTDEHIAEAIRDADVNGKLHSSYTMIWTGIPWNIPRVTYIF